MTLSFLSDPKQRSALFFAIGISSILILIFAWVSEDSFITFRYASNFLKGYGLVYNVGERVQGFTHPFWLFFIALGVLFHIDLFYWVIILGLIFNAITIGLFFRIIHARPNFIVAFVFFCLIVYSSPIFVDFQTSGLESSLTHCLLMYILMIAFSHREKKMLWISLGSGLLLFNRLDQLPLIAPIVVYTFFHESDTIGHKIFQLFVGFMPVILWEIFSLVYYGFLLPNTFYGKVGAMSLAFYFSQGIVYFFDYLIYDFIGGVTMIIGIIVTIIITGQQREGFDKTPLIFVIGALFQIILVICIGGDFMRGRLFLSSFLVIVTVLSVQIADRGKKSPNLEDSMLVIKRKKQYYMIMGCSAAILISCLPFLVGFAYYYVPCLFALCLFFIIAHIYYNKGTIPKKYVFSFVILMLFSRSFLEIAVLDYNNTIGWERKCYPLCGLWVYLKDGQTHPFALEGMAFNQKAQNGSIVVMGGIMGMIGYYAGENVTIIDGLGLTDAYVARLPHKPDSSIRIGHIGREIPPEYAQERVNNTYTENWTDPEAQALWHDMKLITQGDIFGPERWDAMVRVWKE